MYKVVELQQEEDGSERFESSFPAYRQARAYLCERYRTLKKGLDEENGEYAVYFPSASLGESVAKIRFGGIDSPATEAILLIEKA